MGNLAVSSEMDSGHFPGSQSWEKLQSPGGGRQSWVWWCWQSTIPRGLCQCQEPGPKISPSPGWFHHRCELLEHSGRGECLFLHPRDGRTTPGRGDSGPHFTDGRVEACRGIETPPRPLMKFLLGVSSCFPLRLMEWGDKPSLLSCQSLSRGNVPLCSVHLFPRALGSRLSP